MEYGDIFAREFESLENLAVWNNDNTKFNSRKNSVNRKFSINDSHGISRKHDLGRDIQNIHRKFNPNHENLEYIRKNQQDSAKPSRQQNFNTNTPQNSNHNSTYNSNHNNNSNINNSNINNSQIDLTNIKCVVVGDGSVGKTSLLLTFTSNKFPEDHVPTVFDNYTAFTKSKKLNEPVKIHLFDTAGQEDYDQIRPLSYPKTDVFLVCFSVVNPDSLKHVQLMWVPEILKHVSDATIILVGTKLDLRNNEIERMKLAKVGKKAVSLEDIKKVQKLCKIKHYYESSAKTQSGISELFNGVMDIHLKNGELANLKEETEKKCSCSVM